MSVLRDGERPPPEFPIDIFDPGWADWIAGAAEAAACPVDYVAAPLLASVSGLIGNARWPQVARGWSEPPHLWLGSVGHSGNGKSPGADSLMRSVLPEIERRMAADFPDKLRAWQVLAEMTKAASEEWKQEVRKAVKDKDKKSPPQPPLTQKLGPEPEEPRLRQYDSTIEKVAALLATAAPKGLLIIRDEIAGWFESMTAYNQAGRSFWIESYGGRPYRVERQKLAQPIVIPHHAVAVYGSTQPDKLVRLMKDADDGLLARFLWVWPDPVEFHIGQKAPGIAWAIDALDKLRELDLVPGDPPTPLMVPLAGEAIADIEEFGRSMQRRQAWTSGFLCSAYGKARGWVVRLSLVLEYLWWCAASGFVEPPTRVSERAVVGAAVLVEEYFIPMAERVYGDVGLPEAERLTTTLARWIWRQMPALEIVNAREVQRHKLPGLRAADKVATAINGLIEADWLRAVPSRAGSSAGRQRMDYAVNPQLKLKMANVDV